MAEGTTLSLVRCVCGTMDNNDDTDRERREVSKSRRMNDIPSAAPPATMFDGGNTAASGRAQSARRHRQGAGDEDAVSFIGGEEGEYLEEDLNDDECFACQERGQLLCCEACPRSYHLHCLDPPLHAVPKHSWKCGDCSDPLAVGLEKILAARPLHGSDGDGDGNSGGEAPSSLSLEYYVKLKERPYRECRWVSGAALEGVARVSLSVKMRLSSFRSGKPKPSVYLDAPAAATGERQSEEELVAVGIDPAWLEVDKVVGARVDKKHRRRGRGTAGDTAGNAAADTAEGGDDGLEYLVKWRKLDHDTCTWERATFVAAEAPACLERWNQFRRLRGGVDRRAEDEDVDEVVSPPHTPGFTPWDAAPEWLKSAGGDLHQYQVDGVNWLRHAHMIGKNVILADEMAGPRRVRIQHKYK